MLRLSHRAACAAAVFLLAAGHAAAGDTPLKLVQTIPLKGPVGGLDHLTIDGKGQRLFVANTANSSLDVVDLKSGKLVKQVPGQVKVSGVAYAADLDMIYVGNGEGVCNGIDGKDYHVVFTAKAPKADNVAYNATTKEVYVAHGKMISAFDAKSGSPKFSVETPGDTHGFRIDRKAGKLYVNLKPCQVAVVDLAKHSVVTTYPVKLAEGASPLAYDAKDGLLFVGCRKAPMVVVLDSKSGKELTSVAIPGGIDDLHLDARRGRLYASCGDGALAVIEKKGEMYVVSTKLETPKKAKTSAFSGSAGRLYLAVPRQQGMDAPEIRVYQAPPAAKQ
jgi:DNA-binding beta-propeller fold protein YncE